MIGVIRRVIAGEGAASAVRRAHGRVTEAMHDHLLRARGHFVRNRPSFPILNLLSTPAAARLGGIQIHLLARLRAERAMRPVALLTPGTLTLSQPRPHSRSVRSIREALAIAGADTLHIEGAHGLDVESVLQLIDDGVNVILTLHDFALISEHPHRLGEPNRRGLELLQRAAAVVYPSRFLERVHGRPGTIIPSGITPVPRPARTPTPHRPRIAFAGGVHRRKGAQLMQPVVEALRGRGIEWFVFGGGDAEVLRAVRTHGDIRVHGHYAMGTLPRLLARHDIDMVLLLSVEPELYSLTLSESWLAGVPVIAFAHGAIEERIREEGGGWLVPLDRGVDGVREQIEAWLGGARSPEVPMNIATADDAAHAYMKLYRSAGVLAG